MVQLLGLLFVASLPTMQHGVAPVGSGSVVAAPHEGFDEHTAPLARGIAEALGWGWVVAKDYREPKVERWLDVNRPTQRRALAGKLLRPQVTAEGRAVYAQYQGLLSAAGGRDLAWPLDLLVEIHGHARAIPREGEPPLKVQVIELATRGFSKSELRLLKRRYLTLIAALDPADRIPLAVEQLDPSYKFAGRVIGFYFRAGGSKRRGSLRPRSARRVLHFELPSKVRFDEGRRALYVQLLAGLLRTLGR